MQLVLILLLGFAGCTIRLEDSRIDPVAVNKKFQDLNEVDGLIIQKLQELEKRK